MKWFKHMVDSRNDPDLIDSFALFKSDGPYVFWTTIETMAREFDINNPGVNNFSIKFLTSCYSLRRDRVLLVLDFFHRRKRILVKLYKSDSLEMIRLNCSKLRELADEYTEKLLKQKSG